MSTDNTNKEENISEPVESEGAFLVDASSSMPESANKNKEAETDDSAEIAENPELDDNLENDVPLVPGLTDGANKPDEADKEIENTSSDTYADDTTEETENVNKKADFKEWIKSAWLKVVRDCALVILIVVFVYCFFYYHYGIGNRGSDSSANHGSVEIMETENETEENEKTAEDAGTAASATESIQPETVIQYVEIEPDPVETENWKDTIFGEKSSSLLPNITVTGMTTVQKDRTGFRETDFLYALSDFLDANNITGISQVNFEEEILCSSDGATAFRAALTGRSDKVLNVILYPDYPGRYILTLQDAQEVAVEVQTQAQTESSNQNQIQYINPSQETYPVESWQQEEGSGNEEEEAEKYDATTLSIIAIPETLGNYISNQYELQYTLYDYIYGKGYDADAATVTDYSIDADSRQATIYFSLSDGRTVTGTYDKDTNSYSYR